MTDRDPILKPILDAIANSERRTHERIDKLADAVQGLRESDVRHDVEIDNLKQPKRSLTPKPGPSPAYQAAQTGAVATAIYAVAEAIKHLAGK